MSAWDAIARWAAELADAIANDRQVLHVAVFVPDQDPDRLRLAAQIWGPGENTGEVAVGSWTIPLDGSITGRVFRTGEAALCPDVRLDPDYRSFPGARGRSSLTVPVGPAGSLVAVVNLEAPWLSAFGVRDYDRVSATAAAALESFPGRAT